MKSLRSSQSYLVWRCHLNCLQLPQTSSQSRLKICHCIIHHLWLCHLRNKNKKFLTKNAEVPLRVLKVKLIYLFFLSWKIAVCPVAAGLSSISLRETSVVRVVGEAIALHTSSRLGNVHPTCRVILGTLRLTALIFV